MKEGHMRKRGKTKMTDSTSKKIVNVDITDDYFQIKKPEDLDTCLKPPDKEEENSRVLEKIVFVLTSVAVILLTHGLIWAHWLMPIVYVTFTPILIGIRTVCYWKYKWQYFLMDFCYFAKTVTIIFLWFPGQGELFRVVFALANGPVLVAAAIYRNALVYHHHDKITSCYIHFLPAFLTFSIRWFPVSTSRFWFKQFIPHTPAFDMVWLYAVPFAFFFLHSALYCLIVNVVMRPKEPYVTSYDYLAEKFDKLNFIGGPWGQGLVYYGLSLLFCATTLLPALLAYHYFPVHCAFLALVFLKVLWNGACYYVHDFSEHGFNAVD